MEVFVLITNSCLVFNYFRKVLHLRCLARFWIHLCSSKELAEKAPSQMFDMVLNSHLQPLMIFAKRFIDDVWQGSEYSYAIYTTINMREVYQLEVLAIICLLNLLTYTVLTPVTLCTVKSRSSHRKCYIRKCALRNFAKFIGKHLCQSSFLIKLDLSLQLYWKRDFVTGVFVNFTKFLRKLFLHNTSGWQLLQIHVTLYSTYLLKDKNYNICFLTICFYRLCLLCLIYFCRFADF